MMYGEFEEITGLEISYKDYSEIIEPMYGALKIDKFQFCAMIKPTAKEMAKKYADERKAKEMAEQKLVFIETDGMTPNGCYDIGYYAKRIGVDIRTGKVKVRNLTYDEYVEEVKCYTIYWQGDDKAKAHGIGYRNYHDYEVILCK